MSDVEPLATHHFEPGSLDDVLAFFKRTRNELRMLRMVRLWKDRMRLYDINGDCFQLTGLGYVDEEIVPVLKAVDTPFKPESIHLPTDDEYKEIKTGRRYPWAADRVM